MGLDKDTASARISRYESGSMSISLEALFKLAKALDVPAASLVATTPAMAAAIAAMGKQPVREQERLAELLHALLELPADERDSIIRDLRSER